MGPSTESQNRKWWPFVMLSFFLLLVTRNTWDFLPLRICVSDFMESQGDKYGNRLVPSDSSGTQ